MEEWARGSSWSDKCLSSLVLLLSLLYFGLKKNHITCTLKFPLGLSFFVPFVPFACPSVANSWSLVESQLNGYLLCDVVSNFSKADVLFPLFQVPTALCKYLCGSTLLYCIVNFLHVCVFYDTVCTMKAEISSLHPNVPRTLHSAWHMIACQYVFVEWICDWTKSDAVGKLLEDVCIIKKGECPVASGYFFLSFSSRKEI